MRFIPLLLLSVSVVAFAQSAPPVTGIQTLQHDGQTFITWNDAATASTGANYRYNLYRSTTGPITNLSSAMLVQQGIYNNSGQLIGPKPYNQATRQNVANPMSKIQNGGSTVLVWSGAAVYTNLATANAYYAVITHDITGATADSPLVTGSNATTAKLANKTIVYRSSPSDSSFT